MRTGLDAYLFGDILAVTRTDLVWIWGGAAAVLGLLVLALAAAGHGLGERGAGHGRRHRSDTRAADPVAGSGAGGGDCDSALGALLISAMLIVPAATARSFAQTPEQMAGSATLIGAVSVLGGLSASLWLDSPAGPSIVAVAAAIYAVTLVIYRK